MNVGPDCIVIGTANRAIYHVLGVLHQLEVKDQLKKVKHYAGTGIGAAIVGLLVAGCRPKDVIRILTSQRLLPNIFNCALSRESLGKRDVSVVQRFFSSLENELKTKFCWFN